MNARLLDLFELGSLLTSRAEHQFLLVKVNELNNRADYVHELLVKIGNKIGFINFNSESV
jgi:hypothetical protein